MGIEPTSEAWEALLIFSNLRRNVQSGGRQPLEPNWQTFGPVPSPGATYAYHQASQQK